MGLRVRVCKGVTYGRSGFRFGTKIGKTYVSSGRSGTLIAGQGWRYFHHNNTKPKPVTKTPVPVIEGDGSSACVALFWGAMFGLFLAMVLF